MKTVRDIMTSNVITLAPEDDLMKADAIMQRGRVRHLPVVRGHELVGLITHRDLLRAQIQALGHDSGDERTTLVALPIVHRGAPAGIVCEADFVRWALEIADRTSA